MVVFSGMVAPFLRSMKYTAAPFGEGVGPALVWPNPSDVMERPIRTESAPNLQFSHTRPLLLRRNGRNARCSPCLGGKTITYGKAVKVRR